MLLHKKTQKKAQRWWDSWRGSGFLIWACCYHGFPLFIFQHISWVQSVPERLLFHLGDWIMKPPGLACSTVRWVPLGKWPIAISLFVSLKVSPKCSGVCEESYCSAAWKIYCILFLHSERLIYCCPKGNVYLWLICWIFVYIFCTTKLKIYTTTNKYILKKTHTEIKKKL